MLRGLFILLAVVELYERRGSIRQMFVDVKGFCADKLDELKAASDNALDNVHYKHGA